MGVDEKIREVVLDRLERQRRYALVAGLIRKGLASGDSDLRSGMVSSLVYLEFYSAEDAIPIYREILEKGPIRDGCIDYDVKVRTKAVEKLEFLAEGSPDACVELNMIAMDDWNEDVRYAVNESIGNLGNKSPEHAMQLIRYAIENGKALKGVFTGMAHCPEGMIPLLEEYAATLDEKTGSKIQDSITRIRKREEAKKKEKANKETAPQEQGKSAADILRAYDPEHLKLLQELDFGSIVERWTRMLITEPWNHMKMGRAVDELARIDPSRFLELYLWATEPYQNPPEEGQIKREWEKENEKLGRIMTFAKHPELSAEIRGAFIEASEAQYDIKKGTLSQIYKSLGHLCESRKGEPIVPIRDGCYSFVKAVLDSGYVDAMDEEGIVSALKDIVRDESLNFSMMEAAVKAGRSGSLDDIFKIGQFKAEESFLRKLGSGAAGTTYLVHSPELDKDLAMKIVEEGFYSKDEAKILAGLGHENVVKIWYASGSNVLKSGKPVFAILMDYVDGPALGEVAGISEENAVSYCRQLLDGIAYLRRRGVFHRDLNTNNVKLTSDGVVKIIDFGIASQDPEAGPKDNRRYGGSSDLFSWGLLAYKLFTGEHLVLTREEDMSTTVYADTIARHKKSMRTRTGRLKRTYLQKIETKIPEQFRQGIKTALEYREDDSEVFTTIRKEYTDKEADSIRRREVEAILGRTVTDEEYRGLKDVLRK